MKFGRNSTTEKSVDFISRRSVPVNIDEMQKKLSQKAEKEPEHQFENLYGLLCNETWLRVAATHR